MQSREKLVILIADVKDESRQSLLEQVKSLGHIGVPALNDTETLEYLDNIQPDVVFLDLLLPGLGCSEVIRLLHERVTNRWLPVVATSSLVGDTYFTKALSIGADDCLFKPIDLKILNVKLRQYQRILTLQAEQTVLTKQQNAIHQHIADAVITTDANGKLCAANIAAQKLFGSGHAKHILGESVKALTGIDLQTLISSREIKFQPQGQDTIPLGISASQWHLDGQTLHTIVLHDLSEWRQIERMKDEFLANVSHELRTPLTSVLGAVSLLAAGAAGELPPEAVELATVAQRNGSRLSRLIDDVLDLTKLEAERMIFNSQPASLESLMQEAIAANQAYAQRGNVNLKCESQAPRARAMVDTDRFLQVMANLLSNAIKHSQAGQTVHLSLHGNRQGWRIDVRDHGPGISPAFRSRLFEKFSQADSSDRRIQSGTGLGLHISRVLVERMGGSISVQSAPGKGTVFSVSLPAHHERVESPYKQRTERPND
ncbi:Sensor histidine kinase ResE [Polaromonas vacuolata]|uniref:histidine kinase n=1 Tax=Polaromonas vacuolata TaxID=37448 RepID=A0A6H2HDA2_9BURK|nr:hybrid sensor histidine kinase/response regulator [Polaromonas vacuolata]QJC57848.1 Sensor histidine kinase ResE [Polaromonas vacuolata]